MIKKGLEIAALLLLTIIICSLFVEPVLSLKYYNATVNITVKPIYYLHRTALSGVTPASQLMDTIKPPSNQSETTYRIRRGQQVYFYTPPLSAGSIETETWILHIWASTVRRGRTSRLTVEISLVSSDGSTVKANIGSTTSILIDHGYSERNITISGNAVTIAAGDRIRLRLLAQFDPKRDSQGITFYYDGYGSYENLGHETRLYPP